MAQTVSVRLNKGDAPSLGFRLQGGKDFGTALVIQKVNFGSPAEKAGLLAGDSVIKINTSDVFNLRHKDAQDIIVRAGPSFEITVQRGGSTWKPSVTPVPKTPVSNSFAPVTKTSLAAKPQPPIDSIGTGHNLSAKPFSPQLNGAVNGGGKLVNKQYNTPLGLYSEQSIAETLSAQAEVLSTGVLGVNFKKNEKNYDATNSAVFRMVQEAEKEPRDQETEPDSGVVIAPSNIGGLRHVQAPETKPAPATQQLPPGQNICVECERLIVGVFVRIKDKNLHVECFKCSTCGTSLKNVGYYNINQKLYCDVHAKLAAKSNPLAPNLVPVTVPPGAKVPAGTISAALSSHPLPSAGAPLSPLPAANITAQPFQGGTNFSSPRPFSSVSGPLSPSVNSYATLPKSSPTLPKSSPAPASFSSPISVPTSERGHTLYNVIWPPPPDSEEPELPTATPLYFPPSTHTRYPVSSLRETFDSPNVTSPHPNKAAESAKQKDDLVDSISKSHKEEIMEAEEVRNITRSTEAKMSLCSTEVRNITERQIAVERIETAADTQMFVESLLQQRPISPPPLDKDRLPKVEVQTEAMSSETAGKSDTNIKMLPNAPRVVTKVCVCTNSCCNANNGELCENCPMRDLNRQKDCQNLKLKSVENAAPRRYGSPVITGVSVTINNPGKIKETAKDLFTQIPNKKTTSALGSALATAPTEPFTPSSTAYSADPIPLPEETKPYLPPERPVVEEPKPQTQKVKSQEPDTAFVSALRIAPDRPFTPVDLPAPVKKKKPKEDPILKDLPKPTQWMSMVTALTTASDRPYSPFVAEVSAVKETVESEVHVEEINKTKETQQQILKRSAHNQTVLPKPFVKPKRIEKFEPVNDDRVTPQMHFPPVSNELISQFEYQADYSEIKSEISSQIIEQAHLDEQSICKKECTNKEKAVCKVQDEVREEECIKKSVSECHTVCKQTNEQHKKEIIAKQTEETILKKPLELVGYLQKREYLPQYQMSLNYDETIQLPHHKDIKKLLSNDHKKEESKHMQTSSYSKQSAVLTKPITTLKTGETNRNVPQVVFQPVTENKPSHSTFSPRPASLTPSMINKPAPVLPYYQESLVATQLAAPETNIFDPKSPAISRSPSPCPERAPSSSFGRLSPRPISPAAGPPPNPLIRGAPIPTFTKEDRKVEEAKKNISEYIPQYREKVDGIEYAQSLEETISEKLTSKDINQQTCQSSATTINVPSINKYVQNANVQSCSFTHGKQTEVQDTKVQVQSATFTATQQSTVTENINKAQTLTQCSGETKKCADAKKESSTKSSEYPFQKVKNPDITQAGVIGMHITNPQPICSPFIVQQKVKAQEPIKQTPSKDQRQPKNQNITAACSVDQLNVTCSKPSITKAAPTVSTSVPTVSQPNAGSGGGRQAGAIGVTPKRGRGILNVGGLIGSRIAMCGHCHGHIRGPFITALGKIWCPEHFICSTPTCRRQLQDLGFVEEQNQLYCEYCFEQYLAPPCAKCGAKVKGDCLKAIGKTFHPECFSCSYCGKLFANSPFFLEDGQPYCDNDWNELFTTKCFACGFPVEAGDRWVEALNNNYHSQCFNCTMCKKNLEGQSFFAKGGRPFCKNHAR